MFLAVSSLLACYSQNNSEAESENTFLADPTIFYWDGIYYLYGTGGKKLKEGGKDDGFLVYTSTDLKSWEGPKGARNGFALIKGESYGDKGFWAPQVFRYKDKFYMAYTANEQIAIATAPSPLGPFTQEEFRPVSTVTAQIDPYIFFDDDGKIYMYHVRLLYGNRLFVAEINEDLTELDESTLKECISSQANTWEDTGGAQWRVAEGPTVIKDNEKYYFFYSSNDYRNINYAVGYATADSPVGPWTRYEKNPIISRQMLNINGPGHGDIFFNDKNEMYYVLHTHFSNEQPTPRRTAVVRMEKSGDEFRVIPETFSFITK